VALTAALILAGVLLTAGAAKLRKPLSFRVVLSQLIPRPFVPAVGWAIPLVELAIGLALLSGFAVRTAALAAAALLILFELALIQMHRTGASMDCGCFGEVRESASPLSGVVRNIGLLALAALVAALPADAEAASVAADDVVASCLLALAAVCLWLLVSTVATRRDVLLPGGRT
jgi:uncharacterized membrane protein YphA (DoxX/SURF4 family)